MISFKSTMATPNSTTAFPHDVFDYTLVVARFKDECPVESMTPFTISSQTTALVVSDTQKEKMVKKRNKYRIFSIKRRGGRVFNYIKLDLVDPRRLLKWGIFHHFYSFNFRAQHK